MTNPMQQQTILLEKIAQLMFLSVAVQFDSIDCCFEYYLDEKTGHGSVGSVFSYVVGGKRVSDYLNDPENEALNLVTELNRKMNEHTGGRWEKAFLTLESSGKLNAKFQYPTSHT